MRPERKPSNDNFLMNPLPLPGGEGSLIIHDVVTLELMDFESPIELYRCVWATKMALIILKHTIGDTDRLAMLPVKDHQKQSVYFSLKFFFKLWTTQPGYSQKLTDVVSRLKRMLGIFGNKITIFMDPWNACTHKEKNALACVYSYPSLCNPPSPNGIFLINKAAFEQSDLWLAKTILHELFHLHECSDDKYYFGRGAVGENPVANDEGNIDYYIFLNHINLLNNADSYAGYCLDRWLSRGRR